jgi:NADPH-dependent glutamate synthase beta subunit-like oxidoreductase
VENERKPDISFTLEADLVLLAMGFVHPVHEGLLQEPGVELDGRDQIKANESNTAPLSTKSLQEAYKLWREINGAIGTHELQGVVAKCDAWWGENCLYLEPEGRAAFLAAFVGARDLE